ncbi:MAG: D-Ala-D-Ala carboxypeptidase family metallohydrolase [Bacteroidales bacterium]|nr:D-Ala-D-Ala carboxypeptidase family metallohydrolase [Bacteroidales bacterium]
MKDLQLSAHFRLSEFTRSATAQKLGIDNSLDPTRAEHHHLIDSLRTLCSSVLEPLRQHYHTPIVVTSGYRCPELNRAVGGKEWSQHLKGQAADIRVPDAATGRRWLEWIRTHCDFDQLIWETADKRTFWIHVSFARTSPNRKQYIPYLLKK